MNFFWVRYQSDIYVRVIDASLTDVRVSDVRVTDVILTDVILTDFRVIYVKVKDFRQVSE